MDADNPAIRKWRNIPDVLSSAYEDLFMEVVEREDERIKHKDFRARMPVRILKNGKETHPPLPNTITQRLRRARIYACCLSWRKEGTDNKIPTYVMNLLPRECIERNNTRSFRDLHNYEFAEALLQNLGKHGERAGNNRRDGLRKTQAYIGKMKEQAKLLKEKSKGKEQPGSVKHEPSGGSKRAFSEADLDSEDLDQGPVSKVS